MKKTAFLSVLLLFAVSAAASPEERVAASRAAVKDFAGELKNELLKALQAGGPMRAISVCSRKAPAIADRISQEKGWEIGRTSLRTRNASNTPDSWERRVLEEFEVRRTRGEDVGRMEYSEVVLEEGRSVFRYMKAIPTGELCLTCHGKSVAPDLGGRIKELYPEDRATGFSAGEIRGAFTITQPM